MAENNDFIECNAPGFGRPGEIDDCAISVTSDHGVVTVSFSTDSGVTLLVLDVVWAEMIAARISQGAEIAAQPERPNLRLVGGGRER